VEAFGLPAGRHQALADEDAVAAAEAGVGDDALVAERLAGAGQGNLLPTARTDAAADEEPLVDQLDLAAGVDGERQSAMGARDLLVVTEQRLGHGAGGDREGLEEEQAYEDDCQGDLA